MPDDTTFHASLMLAEVHAQVGAVLEKVKTDHPGLTESQSSKLTLLTNILRDVENEARGMKDELLLASQVQCDDEVCETTHPVETTHLVTESSEVASCAP